MKFNPDYELEGIILKYELESTFSDFNFIDYVEKHIISIWHKCLDDIPVAIFGNEEDFEYLRKLINFKEKNVICFINAKDEESFVFDGIQVEKSSSINNIDSLGVKLILIASVNEKNSILHRMISEKKIQCIDIYDINAIKEYIKYPIHYYTMFANSKSMNSEYIDLYFLRKLYENEKKVELKQEYLLGLILKYLKQRDFIYTYKFLNEYLRNKYKNSNRVADFLNDLNTFIIKFKSIISTRTQKDVNLFIIDALRKKDLDLQVNNKMCMSFLKSLVKKSVFFENAFATSTYTRACLRSIFNGNISFYGNVMEQKGYYTYWDKNDVISKLINKENYVINNNSVMELRVNDKRIKQEFNYDPRPSTSYRIWRFLVESINEEKNIFSIIHILEAHQYYICGYHKDNFLLNDIENYSLDYKEGKLNFKHLFYQYAECLEYIDTQLEFYLDFLSKDSMNVFISDHGQLFGEYDHIGHLYTTYDESINVLCMIVSNTIKPFVYSELFSLKDLINKLFEMVIENKIIEDKTSYILAQRDRIYKSKVNNSVKITELYGKYLNAFKLIRSSKDKYIFFEDGTEEYYILPNENTNLIYDNKYIKRINELRDIVYDKNFLIEPKDICVTNGKLLERYMEYYNTLNQWIKIMNSSKKLSEYFFEKNIKYISVYGLGEIAKRFYEQLLREKDINIVCFIEKIVGEQKSFNNIPIKNINDAIKNQNIDLIIVTPIYDYESIKNNFNGTGFENKIVSLRDIINIISEAGKL